MSLIHSLPAAICISLTLWRCDYTAEAVNNEPADTTLLLDTVFQTLTSVEKDTSILNEFIRRVTTITTTDSIRQIRTADDSTIGIDTVNMLKDTVTTVDTATWPLDTIKGAAGLAWGEGFILVTNRDTSLEGTFLIDTSKDKIIGIVRSDKGLPPNTAAMANDSILIVGNTDYKDGSIGWADLRTGEKDLVGNIEHLPRDIFKNCTFRPQERHIWSRTWPPSPPSPPPTSHNLFINKGLRIAV